MKRDMAVATALKLIEIGKLTFEEIASVTGLPVEKIRELAEEKSA